MKKLLNKLIDNLNIIDGEMFFTLELFVTAAFILILTYVVFIFTFGWLWDIYFKDLFMRLNTAIKRIYGELDSDIKDALRKPTIVLNLCGSGLITSLFSLFNASGYSVIPYAIVSAIFFIGIIKVAKKIDE